MEYTYIKRNIFPKDEFTPEQLSENLVTFITYTHGKNMFSPFISCDKHRINMKTTTMDR